MMPEFFMHMNQRMQAQPQVPQNFAFSLKAFPGYMCPKVDLDQGNRVLLPPNILHNLSQYRLPSPLIFSIQNTVFGNTTNVGVLEFTAENGACYLPNWLFEIMNLEIGLEINIMLVTAVPRGKFVKIQPHETAFIDLPDPRAVLEKQLTRYTCITQGDTVSISVAGRSFLLNILEVRPLNPLNCICVIDADVEVDFAPPLDYKEPERNMLPSEYSLNLDDHALDEQENQPFQGKGIKLNGQVVKEEVSQKKKVSNEEYDPRKQRLPNGVRQIIIKDDFKDFKVGLKIGMSSVHKPTTVVYGSTGGPKNIPPLAQHKATGAISGTTGYRPHFDKEDIMTDPGRSQTLGQSTQTTAPNTYNSQTRGFNASRTSDLGPSYEHRASQPSYFKESSTTIDKSSSGENSRFKPESESEMFMDVEEIPDPKIRKRLNKLPSNDPVPNQKKFTKKK